MKKKLFFLVLCIIIGGYVFSNAYAREYVWYDASGQGFTVLSEDIIDTPQQARIDANILIDSQMNEQDITAALKNFYRVLKDRRVFRYHDLPSSIYIYAHSSREYYENAPAQWMAMLAKTPTDSAPIVNVNPKQFRRLGAVIDEEEQILLDKDKEIFQEIIKAQDKAAQEAFKKYPGFGLSSSDYDSRFREDRSRARDQFRKKLYRQYMKKLSNKYRLKEPELEAILEEGLGEDWPLPPGRN